jgi:hypothetical protein
MRDVRGIFYGGTAMAAGLALASSAPATVQCSAFNGAGNGQYSQATSAVNAVCAAGADIGSANNSTGILRAAISSPPLVLSSSGYASLGNTLTFTGFQGNAGYLIPITVTVDGSYGASGDGQVESLLNLVVQGNDGEIYARYIPSQAIDTFETIDNGGASFSDVSSNKSDITGTITEYAYVSALDSSFSLLAQLELDGNGPNFSDFSHTAALGIDLPTGLSFTSSSPGFLSGVPEQGSVKGSSPSRLGWAAFSSGGDDAVSSDGHSA